MAVSEKNAPKKIAGGCRECDGTPKHVCDNCGWGICGRHAKKRKNDRRGEYRVCPTCAQDGF